MNSKKIFFLLCLPIRLSLVILSKLLPIEYIKYLGFLLLIPSLGFFTIYLFDLRKTGLETGGKIIWWNNLRVIHGLLYLGYSLYAIKKNKNAWIFLLIDFLVGLSASLFHYNVQSIS